MTDTQDSLVATGGICAPLYLHDGFSPYRPMRRGDTFQITIPVQGRFRRWRHRRAGWSTEWTQEHEYVPITDAIPKFTAVRGGVSFK